MDALSHLIDLAGIRGALDLRCHLAGAFSIDHDAAASGEAPFHLVLSGEALLQVDGGKVLHLQAGDFLLLPRGHAHLIHSAGATPSETPAALSMDRSASLTVKRNTENRADLDLLCGRFRYTPGAADLVIGQLPDVLHVGLGEESGLEVLRNMVTLMRHEVEGMQSGALAIVTALSQALFVLVLRAYTRRDGVPASLLMLLSDPRLSRAVLAMLHEPERPWTLVSLAEQAMMSRASFARHFAARGNISPWELLTTVRVQLARELLTNGNLPTAAVAERVGYQSESAFGKVFSHRMGVTPAAFRRAQRSR